MFDRHYQRQTTSLPDGINEATQPMQLRRIAKLIGICSPSYNVGKILYFLFNRTTLRANYGDIVALNDIGDEFMFLFCVCQASESGLIGILNKVDSDIVGAMGIVSIVFSFIFAIVAVTSITHTIQAITMAKMQRNLIQDMLAKGYSCDEINMLINGKQKGILSRLFDSRSQEYVNSSPVPPVKNRRPVG